jgi:hypothetical protein
VGRNRNFLFAYLGFRSHYKEKKSRPARAASIFALALGILWIILSMSAIIYNTVEIIGEM